MKSTSLLKTIAALYLTSAAATAQTVVGPAIPPSAPTGLRVQTVEDVVRNAIQKNSGLTNVSYAPNAGTEDMSFNLTDASKVNLSITYSPSSGMLSSGVYSAQLTNIPTGLFGELLTARKVEKLVLEPAASSVGMKTYQLTGNPTNHVYIFGVGKSSETITATFAVVPAENKVGHYDRENGYMLNSYPALTPDGKREVIPTALAIRKTMQTKRK